MDDLIVRIPIENFCTSCVILLRILRIATRVHCDKTVVTDLIQSFSIKHFLQRS